MILSLTESARLRIKLRSVTVRANQIVKNSDGNFERALRCLLILLLGPCLHGVGDPGLVGLVSFVFTLWGTQNKRNLLH